MRSILYVLAMCFFVACAASPWPALAAETGDEQMTDETALNDIYSGAVKYSKKIYEDYKRKYGAISAAYMVQIKRHDIYAAYVESLQDKTLQKIAFEEWVHRESQAMIGSGKKFMSSFERVRREEDRKRRLEERRIKEKEKEVGVELEDVQ